MKFKTTVKEINNYYATVISLGYCDAQHLLSYRSPIAYNAGIYGWNFDLYVIDGIAITTGYRNTTGYRPDYKLVKKYEDKVQDVQYNHYKDKDVKKETEKLLHKFINAVIKEMEGIA